MSTSIANLSVRISGNSAGLKGACDDSRKSLTSLQKAANTSLGFIGKSFIAAGAAALGAAAAVAKMAKTGFQSIDSVSDLSKRIGISVQALSELQHAATMADVDLDSLATGLQKMLVTLQKARSGSGEAAAALSNIGLNASQLTSMRPEQAFARIADAIAGIEDPYRRAKAAQDIFGKGGQSLIPLLAQGSKNLADMAEQARGLGNAVTAVEAEKINALDDAFKKSKAAVVGLSQSVAVALAPTLVKILNDMTSFVAASDGLRSVTAGAVNAVGVGLQKMSGAWDAVKAAAGAARTAASAFGFDSLASLVKTTAAIGALIVAGARVGGMIKATSIAWLALKANVVTSIATMRAWGAATMQSFFAASLAQGRFIAGMRLLGATAVATGGVMKQAIVFGIGGAAVVAVTAFAQVVARQITQNEKWSDSALHVARSWGLFKDATTTYGLALEDLGKTSNDIRVIQEKLAQAKTLEAKIDLTRDLSDELHKQLEIQKELVKLQQETGQDAGITDDLVEKTRQKIAEVEKAIDQFNEARNGSSASAFVPPEMPDDTQSANDMADAVRALNETQAASDIPRNYAKETQAAVDAFNAGAISAEQFNASIAEINQSFRDAAAGDLQKFNETMAQVQQEIDSINQSPIDIKIAELTSDAPNLLKEQLDQYRKALEQLDLTKLGARLREQLTTPLDEAQKQFDDIQRAAAAGVITADEQKQLLAQLQEQVDGSREAISGPSDQFGTAASRGSVESNRLDALFRNQQSRTNPKDKSEKQLKEAEKSNQLLAQIASAVSKADTIVEVNI